MAAKRQKPRSKPSSKPATKRGPRRNPNAQGDWDERAGAAAADYANLHGLAPSRIDAVEVVMPRYQVALGPLTRVCYRKRIVSDLPEHAHLPLEQRPIIEPEYCHDYGEEWGARELSELSDIAAHDDQGRLWVIPRGNNTVTDRGIEDLPSPAGSAVQPRRNPVQRGVVLTEIAVRTPSLFTMWFTAVVVGLFGVALMPLFQLLLAQQTRLSPADRGAATLATGVVGGLVMRKHPRFAAAVTLGGIAAALPSLVEALRLHYAMREPVGVAVDVLPPQAPSSGAR